MPFAEKGNWERRDEMERIATNYSGLAAWVAPVGFSREFVTFESLDGGVPAGQVAHESMEG